MGLAPEKEIAEAPEGKVPTGDEILPEESKTTGNVRCFFRLQGVHRFAPCEPNQAVIIAYTSPTIDDEAELQEQYNIDYHTLESSLDPDELSRLEIEPDHAAIIFKRPKSFCAGEDFSA